MFHQTSDTVWRWPSPDKGSLLSPSSVSIASTTQSEVDVASSRRPDAVGPLLVRKFIHVCQRLVPIL